MLSGGGGPGRMLRAENIEGWSSEDSLGALRRGLRQGGNPPQDRSFAAGPKIHKTFDLARSDFLEPQIHQLKARMAMSALQGCGED